MHSYPLNDSDFKIFLPEKPLPDGVQLEAVLGAKSGVPGEDDGEAIYRARVPELH
jgi:hypothetical protein